MEKGNSRVSVIIPFLNEEESLPRLYEGLCEVMGKFSRDSEVIFVNDGSTDRSPELVKKWAAADTRIKLVSMRKNFGQTACWAAGIYYASGDVLAFLDADLQNDPRDLPMLIDKLEEGYDVVSGWRVKREDNLWTRKIPSWTANWLISKITGVHLHDYGCSLKVYRKKFIKDVKLYGEMHRFLPAYSAWEGARIAEVPVRHSARKYGASKYGLIRIFKVLLDLITVGFLGGFATKPIYFFGGLGAGSLACGFAAFLVVAWRALVLDHKEATPMVFLMVVFLLGGVQFILMGLLAEIAVRTYHEAQAKPVYKIGELTNLYEPSVQPLLRH